MFRANLAKGSSVNRRLFQGLRLGQLIELVTILFFLLTFGADFTERRSCHCRLFQYLGLCKLIGLLKAVLFDHVTVLLNRLTLRA